MHHLVKFMNNKIRDEMLKLGFVEGENSFEYHIKRGSVILAGFNLENDSNKYGYEIVQNFLDMKDKRFKLDGDELIAIMSEYISLLGESK